MADPFRSKRLLYRAPESPEDEPFFLGIQQDSLGYQNSNISIPRPQGKGSMLGVVICLPPDDDCERSEAEGKKRSSTPIGAIKLSAYPARMMHHRFSEIGIDIDQEHQGRGYGSQAILWCLGWAFERAGLHRVLIRAFEWNEGAVRLPRRLGFVEEERGREALWFEGRWWDDVSFGILEGEWRVMKGRGSRGESRGRG
ncbi:hypothetical protein CLAFUW4_11028 [Fulvia fulva]|uniref:N-acetyltransferase domain-containing protein n=1 Tax=Passalora fulva TaxID=5499 RepID=A0A9Q8US03_PASFU|nr:uncharacterized protein CLAFUR5_10070 [Fulvia fulva]KAK4619844.1 hypothetical protein CLAFUR4_11033 [Fulvia fulva]KAK4620741.1 hypothetical protein CLAFUR0_11039 [Fulvia fulva]UJO20349.1 hypothetical protein CLAFUR5_10070 [Fulvia fulva]WPV17577.1 hypothetical protein CLAFUW4_11028 [Fulvia fulva]WPV32559.1 hypothetical protein CLAFUW7_11025 [Fulvia fulva]